MAAEVIRWLGGPGSGKTHQLVEFVRSEIADGRSPRDLAIMSFSRAQTHDLRTRIGVLARRDDDCEIRTIHGTVLAACIRTGLIDMRQSQIIAPGERRHVPHYKTFCDAHDLKFAVNVSTDDIDEGAVSSHDLPPGNALFAISTYLKATLRENDDWEEAQREMDISFPAYCHNVTGLLNAWDTYKCGKHLLEHEDYVHVALREQLPPPAPVLIVDEYQDTSPSQHAVIQRWIEHPDTERVYLAGDSDQSIYGFRGCDPSLLLSYTAVDRGSGSGNSRPVSRRCPGNVLRLAETVLGHPGNATPVPDTEGLITTVSPRGMDDLARQIEDGVIRAGRTGHRGPDVYILCRYGHYVQDLSAGLFDAGIPHTSVRDGRITRWQSIRLGRERGRYERGTVDLWALTCCVRRIADVGGFAPLNLAEADALVAALVPEADRKGVREAIRAKRKRPPRQLVAGDVFQHVACAEGADVLGDMNIRGAARAAIAACLRREEQRGFVIRPDQVRIDTIHASKGLEAPVVLLHSGYIRGRLAGLLDAAKAAEERRVYYVGMTRTSDVLLFLDAFKGSGVTSPILQEVM